MGAIRVQIPPADVFMSFRVRLETADQAEGLLG